MQVSGLHFTYTGTRAAARSPGCGWARRATTRTPIPNDARQSYTGTANSFMIGGGDGFTVLEARATSCRPRTPSWCRWSTTWATLPDPFTYATDGRIAIG